MIILINIINNITKIIDNTKTEKLLYPLGAYDTFPKQSFEGVIVVYILS